MSSGKSRDAYNPFPILSPSVKRTSTPSPAVSSPNASDSTPSTPSACDAASVDSVGSDDGDGDDGDAEIGSADIVKEGNEKRRWLRLIANLRS